MSIDLSVLVTALSVISILLGGAVWVMSLTNKIVARVVIDESRIKNLEDDFIEYKAKIIKLENGDLIEKTVKNTIYSQQYRDYFKILIGEAITHQLNNNKIPFQHILESIDEIKHKLEHKK